MVVVALRGGLGNQMFQYAAGLAAARAGGVALVLDTVYLNDRFPRPAFSPRTYDLDIFCLQPAMTPLSRISKSLPIPGVWLGIDLTIATLRGALGGRKVLREKRNFIFNPEVVSGKKELFLWGFWQTPKYFEGIKDELLQAFRFRYPLKGEAAAIAEDIKNSNAIALHVRRADYITAKYKKTYGKTNLSYYETAIKNIADKVKDPKFYIFSDDIAWCKEHIKPAFSTEYMERNSEGPKANYHLQLMSLCKHNIIANSTFSWWGAWLNRNPEKIVIAPAIWHMGGRPGEDDIIPSGWKRI
jgi:hypothetical protein